MKEAKSEAESIITAYRAEMEANYQKKFNMVHTPFSCLRFDAILRSWKAHF